MSDYDISPRAQEVRDTARQHAEDVRRKADDAYWRLDRDYDHDSDGDE